MSSIGSDFVESTLEGFDRAAVAENATTVAYGLRGGTSGVPGVFTDREFTVGNMQKAHVATFHKPEPLYNLHVSISVGWLDEDSR